MKFPAAHVAPSTRPVDNLASHTCLLSPWALGPSPPRTVPQGVGLQLSHWGRGGQPRGTPESLRRGDLGHPEQPGALPALLPALHCRSALLPLS